ncbi:hypothetical protein K402DRAFT_403490 [Aulographum hederae CBS 113979]|uniref:DNA mismatch repair proteins mutS family domain-containing protein n=1 Tax=Aulographum hederae CBS 113979 TaxID=1176131 RepID=A0A6G1H3P2_9PEZI|nr:hypothetical protein K402DRAFT_403490 [Aulographum hederae CBS 113979]
MESNEAPSTSYTSASTSRSYPSYSYLYPEYTTTTSRPRTGRPGTARPRTGASTIARVENQQVVCAISESRGISPTVGLAFLNLHTGEAVLSQISDSQTYVRTVHKLRVFGPTIILVMASAIDPKSKLVSIIEESMDTIGSYLNPLDRRYWAETTGLDYIQQLAFAEDLDAIKISIGGNYFAVCCFAAVLKHVELELGTTFPYHSLRIKYEPSEGSMMIDLSTIRSLELIQNIQNPKSKDCLFGLLNETLTTMGSRLLRSSILQPGTDAEVLNTRFDALAELASKEDMFFATRQALKPFLDVDRILTALITVPTKPNLQLTEQAINNVIMLKHFLNSIKPVYEALAGAQSGLLTRVQQLCNPRNVEPVQDIIDQMINEDTTYATQPLDLRNQRTYAVKSGVNGLLDVARQTYKEASQDAFEHVGQLAEEHNLSLEAKFDNVRHFYIRLPASELDERLLPPVFINVFRKKSMLECQTLELMKLNQKITDSHQEILLMSDQAVQVLISDVREHMSILFKICESIALLDMMAAFAQLITSQQYVRPKISDTLAVKQGRHPLREKIQSSKFIPNDVYATQQTRFQIITGCNMSGKSTYIRTVALMSVMVQIGCFVPAEYAAFPIMHQLFARVSMDDSIEANVSTFAAEMREMSFILHNIDKRSIAIIDELGRGTSTRDGLAIAIAIAEALVESKALVWFATHFQDLARFLGERNGVVNLHLAVEMGATNPDTMTMLYRISEGPVQEKHYGLALAKVVPLPPGVVEHATIVAEKLERRHERKKRTSAAVLFERRRKLILSLKEHLEQTRAGSLEGNALSNWLRTLQQEFVNRMTAIEEEVRQEEDVMGSDDESTVRGRGDGDGSEETVTSGREERDGDMEMVDAGESVDESDENSLYSDG